jgi:hypothetical protein
MIFNAGVSQAAAVEAARTELRGLPIAWHDFEQAAFEVARANPGAGERELTDLIISTALEHWNTGMSCC